MKSKTKKLVLSALVAALACVATLVLHIPSPLGGYINLGDGIVLVGGWLLGPLYGFIAGGIGPALADVFLGYFIYAPATFVIKGAVAIVAYFIFRSLAKSVSKAAAYVLSGIVAEAVMVVGYYVFEGFIYGFASALVNVPPNIIQGAVGVIAGALLSIMLAKTGAAKRLE